MTKNIFEIGVNTGSDTQPLLDKYPTHTYYGFEPTRELVSQALWPKFNDPRVNIIPMAVDIEDGFKTFNIAGQGDWGCSSLYEFDEKIHEKWENRSDFKMTHSYPVPCMRLETFIEVFKIEGDIDYMWIDAQGNDYNVLLSMGHYINDLKAGRLECAYTVELYQGTGNNLSNVTKYLDFCGFKYDVKPDDVGKECNVEFYR